MAGAAPQEHTGKGGKKALDAELNLVPFIDLLSCCISFLLITAVWTQIAGLQVASSGGPPETPQKQENTIDVKLLLSDKGYSLSMAGALVEIPKIASKDGALAYDKKTLDEKLKTLKTSLPDQTAITVLPEDAVAYADLVETVDACMGQQLKNVTVAPQN
jgi:biopolymer transport protein TolR